MYQSLTLDVIGRCAFGLQTNAQTDKDDPFLKNIRILFNGLATTVIQPLVSKYQVIYGMKFASCSDQSRQFHIVSDKTFTNLKS